MAKSTGNIDQLNFEAIIDDKKFNKKLADMEDRAKQFNTSVSNILRRLMDVEQRVARIDTKSAISQQQLAREVAKTALAEEKVTTQQEKTNREREKGNRLVGETNQKVGEQSRIMKQLVGLAGTYFSVQGVRSFLSELIKITGEFEVQKMAMTSMLQSSEAADNIFNAYRQLALESPYTFQDFTKFGKQLLAFNIPAEDLVDTTKRLADVAAGLGVDMGRIILAYGQIKSAGVLKGTELRQLTEAGVPILDSLAKQIEETTGKTVRLAEVFQMISKKQIPFEMVEKAFREMTDEGGKFYNMQEVLVETLQGKIGKLRDVWQQTLYDMGSTSDLNAFLKGTIDWATKMVGNLDKIGKILLPIVSSIGAYGSSLLIVRGVQEAVFGAKALGDLLRMVRGIKSAETATKAWAIASKGIGGAFAIVALLGVTILEVYKNATRLNKELDKIISTSETGANDKINQFNELAEKLKKAQKGSQDYRDAISELNSKYGEYLPHLLNEKNALDEITTSANAAAAAIRNKARANAEDQGIKAIEGEYGGTRDDRTTKLINSLYNLMNNESPFNFKNEERSKRDLAGFLYDFTNEIKTAISDNTIDEFAGDLENRFALAFARKFNEGLDSRLYRAVDSEVRSYFNIIRKIADKESELSDRLTASFGDQYTSEKHKERETKILADFENRLAYINSLQMSVEKRKEAIAKAEKIRDDELDKMYEDLGIPKPPKKRNGIDTTIAPDYTKEINKIKRDISDLKQLKEAYDTLLPAVGKDNIVNVLEDVFKMDISNTDFERQIDELIVKLNGMGEAGREAAESIRIALGKNPLSEIEKGIKARERAETMLREFLEKDFGIEGQGIAAKISKILTDLANKNAKMGDDMADYIKQLDVEEELQKRIIRSENKEMFAANNLTNKQQEQVVDAYWDMWREEQIIAWKEHLELAIKANKKLSDEQIVGLADDEFRIATGKIDLTNLDSKTIAQLKEIRLQLENLRIDPETLAAIKDPEAIERFVAAFNQLRGNAMSKTDSVIKKKDVESVRKLIAAFQGIRGILSDIGDITDSEFLKSMDNILSLAEKITGAISENEEVMRSLSWTAEEAAKNMESVVNSVDYYTMILKIIIIIISTISGHLAQAKKEVEDLEEAIIDASYELSRAAFTASLNEGVSSIFGDDVVKQIDNVSKALDKLSSRKNEVDDLLESWKKVAKATAHYGTGGGGNSGPTADMLKEWDNYIESIDEWQKILVSDPLSKWDNSATYAARKSIADFAKELGADLYDEYGNINPELIDEIIKLTKASGDYLELLTKIKEYSEEYAEAQEILAKAVSDMFGSIADDMVDRFIDNFKKMGDAVDDLGNIFAGLGETIVKSMLKSYVIDEVLKKYEGDAKKMLEGYSSGDLTADDLARMTSDFADAVTADVEARRDVINAMLMAFQDRGLLGEDGSDTLANGIKGITEDTASLLASYVNAIRADVSAIRMQDAAGWKDVNAMLGIIGTLPTLNDYMAQVAATNANIAESNRQILERIDRLTTTSTGRAAIAVDVQ